MDQQDGQEEDDGIMVIPETQMFPQESVSAAKEATIHDCVSSTSSGSDGLQNVFLPERNNYDEEDKAQVSFLDLDSYDWDESVKEWGSECWKMEMEWNHVENMCETVAYNWFFFFC